MLKRIRPARRPSARMSSTSSSITAARLIESLEGRTMFDANFFSLSSGNFLQDWTNTALISANDDWSGVPSIVGFRGDDLTTSTATDPQTILTASTVVDVNANQANPTTFSTGGVTEFQITDATIAMKGSGTADAPYIQLHLNTVGRDSVNITYDLRDLDSSATDATQAFALQYRVGDSGNFTNVPEGFVGDATDPNAASKVTSVNVVLPDAVENVSNLEVRIITSNANGNDEYVGVDNISVSSVPISGQSVSLDSATASVSEGVAGGVAHLPVSRGPSTDGTLTVDYTTTAITAVPGSDYTTTSGTLTFNPGDTQKFIDVPITNDSVIEPYKQFKVTISNPQISPSGTPLSLGTAEEVVTLNDDDRPVGGKLLSAGPLTQNWSSINQIVNDDDWSGIAYITGYRGDDLITATGVDPQTVLADGNATPVDVNANKDDVYLGFNVSGGGGVAEIDTNVPDPTVTLNGSGTADAPFLLLDVDTTGVSSVDVSYNLRDMDPSIDDATQQVALQYRVGNTGAFTNVPAGFVADATDGGAATKVTAVSATVNDPVIANQPLVQFRILTTNAVGNDEYVGVDDIVIKQTASVGLPAWVAPGSAATWDGTMLTVTGATTIVADPGSDNPSIAADGAAAVVTFNPTVDRIIHVAGISLTNGATAAVTSVGAGTPGANQRMLVVGAGGIIVSSTSNLDIADNAVVLKGVDPAAVQTLLSTGYNAGHWNGTGGLTSSIAAASTETSIGFASNASLNKTDFQGVTGLTPTDVLVKYTYSGDANLDAKVDIGDLGLLAGAWQQSGKTWLDGDFTYDGAVNIGDLGLLAGNWQKGVGNN
jgi:hypothetical protein